MANPLYLALVLHNHQPVGNFDFVLDEAYANAYEPLIGALERHPAVRVTMHWSGPLRDWLHDRHPELLGRIRALVGRKQIEPLGGGYYEPVLVALPDADKAGQLAKLSEAVQLDFGERPRGAWLAERAWEPHLPRFLDDAGIDYTLLDDTHFTPIGLTPDDLFGYYVTEDQGYRTRVFASARELAAMLPWQPVEQVLAWLRRLADRPLPAGAPPRLVMVAADGEQFGLWPGAHARCWGDEGWMEAFCGALEHSADWLSPITLGDATRMLPPLGRVYLPTSAYGEMAVWSLPPARAQELVALRQQLLAAGRDDILRYVRGATWRSFMTKYPEVNTLHKKIVFASQKVHQIRKPALRRQALDHLWASQCDCPFWHGVFGGVYLFHIREAAARHLIEAEAMADRSLHAGETWSEAVHGDIDCDGWPEVMLSTDTQQLLIAPAQGGSVLAWDWRAAKINLLNILSRRPEAYHAGLIEATSSGTLAVAGQPPPLDGSSSVIRAKEPDLHQRLIYDPYRRAGLVDHVIPNETTSDDWQRAAHRELGDFVGQLYEAKTSTVRGAVALWLSRDGSVEVQGERRPLRVEKKIVARPGVGELSAQYVVTNLAQQTLSVRFGVETNWGVSGGDTSDRAYIVWPGGTLARLNAAGARPAAAEAAIVHEWIGRVVVRLSEPATWWHFPIETVSNSEAGFERVYQGVSFLAHWPLDLAPGAAWRLSMTFVLAPAANPEGASPGSA